jgi:tRNA (guanine-N7-)-methyltransferase
VIEDLPETKSNLGTLIKNVRVREHVNPLGKRFQTPTPPPNWDDVYAEWSKPLSLDIGCGRGRYLLQVAARSPDWNFLGLEIREPLVHEAIAAQQALGLTNLHYLFCNVNVSLSNLLPKEKLQQVTIQFPDPWFKRRQHKRRAVQPDLVETLAELMIPNGQVLMQSDIHMVASEMLKYFEASGKFVNLAGEGKFAGDEIYPNHLATEREEWVIKQEGTIYRANLQKKPSASGVNSSDLEPQESIEAEAFA